MADRSNYRGPARLVSAGITAAFVGAAVLAASAPAVAAPGTPGIPSDPVVVYVETFEGAPDTGDRTLLTSLVGPTGIMYTADPFWLDPSLCNGFAMSYSNATRVSTDCTGSVGPDSAYASLRQLAHALGQINGTDPATNSVSAAFTHAAVEPADNLVEFEMLSAYPMSGANKFLQFSVNAAAVNCWAPDQPSFRFYQKHADDTETAVSSVAINPCTDPRSSVYVVPNVGGFPYPYFAGAYTSDTVFLSGGEDIRFLMRNEQSGLFGNDAAFDDIKIIDVSPQLDKSFADTTLAYGDVTRLTFTVTNTSELGAKVGWSFSDNLPTGMVVAPVPNTSTNCTNGVVVAVAGSNTIDVSGDLLDGEVSCTAEVDVRMPLASSSANPSGLLANCAGNISDVVGLNLPACATVQLPPAITAIAATGAPISPVGAMAAVVALILGGLLVARAQRKTRPRN